MTIIKPSVCITNIVRSIQRLIVIRNEPFRFFFNNRLISNIAKHAHCVGFSFILPPTPYFLIVRDNEDHLSIRSGHGIHIPSGQWKPLLSTYSGQNQLLLLLLPSYIGVSIGIHFQGEQDSQPTKAIKLFGLLSHGQYIFKQSVRDRVSVES